MKTLFSALKTIFRLKTIAAGIENQERLKEWEWQIVAANKAGEGMPSNTVMTVL